VLRKRLESHAALSPRANRVGAEEGFALTIAQPASRYTTMPARRIEAPGSAKAAVVDLLKRGFQTQSMPNAPGGDGATGKF